MRKTIATAGAIALLATSAISAQGSTVVKPVRVVEQTSASTVETYQYSGDLLLDATYDKSSSGRPWVLLIHGGYGYQGSRADMNDFAQKLNDAGFQTFSADYTLLREGARWPQPRTDAANALIWIKAHAEQFGINPGRGAVLGFSFGGMLASQLATSGSGEFRTRGVALIAPQVDPYRGFRYGFGIEPTDGYEPTYGYRKGAVMSSWLAGCYPDANDEPCWANWRNMTPQNLVTADDAPHYIVQGVDDPTVPGNSSNALVRALQAADVDVTIRYAASDQHNMSLADAYAWGITNFLKDVTA